MDSKIEIPLAGYKFLLRNLRWEEEVSIDFSKYKGEGVRLILAQALVSVSGFSPKTWEESFQIFKSIPSAIVTRVFQIWKGSLPPDKKFTTSDLYSAPEPETFIAMDSGGEVFSQMEQDIASRFGPSAMREERDLEEKILQAARLRHKEGKLP